MTYTTEELRASMTEPRCTKCGQVRSNHNVRHPFQPSHETLAAPDLAAEVIRLREREAALTQERDRLRGAMKRLTDPSHDDVIAFLEVAARNVDFDGDWSDFDIEGGVEAVISRAALGEGGK